jgi:hypothetical protein
MDGDGRRGGGDMCACVCVCVCVGGGGDARAHTPDLAPSYLPTPQALDFTAGKMNRATRAALYFRTPSYLLLCCILTGCICVYPLSFVHFSSGERWMEQQRNRTVAAGIPGAVCSHAILGLGYPQRRCTCALCRHHQSIGSYRFPAEVAG